MVQVKMLEHFVINNACDFSQNVSAAMTVMAGLCERSGRTERFELRESQHHCPLSAYSTLPPHCWREQPARPLIKPADLLLLIDFLIINSVCPSISLRRRISPDCAQVLLRGYLPTSANPGSQQISTTLIKSFTASAGFLDSPCRGSRDPLCTCCSEQRRGGCDLNRPLRTPVRKDVRNQRQDQQQQRPLVILKQQKGAAD